MSHTDTHRDCLTAYSPYWKQMYCFTHDRTFKTSNPTHPPAGALLGRLRAFLTGRKSATS